MKQYLQLLMAALLLAACSTNDPTDDDSTIMPANDGYVQNGGVIAKFGDFEADWVINQEVVDHTTMTYNGKLSIRHFPNNYLLKGLFTKLYADDETPQPTTTSDNPLDNDTPVVLDHNSDDIIFSNTGNTTSQAYFDATSATTYQVEIGNNTYEVKLNCVEGGAMAVYEQNNDRWIVTWHLNSITATNTQLNTEYVNQFSPTLTMTLVTTKRTR